jgi:hypothetical protein
MEAGRESNGFPWMDEAQRKPKKREISQKD